MTHGVDDDLCLGDLVDDQIGIRSRHQPANGRIIRVDANIRIDQEQVDDSLYSRLDALRSMWRMDSDVVKDRIDVGESRKGIA
jgi:hypothetical protein